MTDHPMLFSAPMVRALLDGTKTQTRRILKPQPKDLLGVPSGCKTIAPYVTNDPDPNPDMAYYWRGEGGCWNSSSPIKMPIATGDRIWVRETFKTTPDIDDMPPSQIGVRDRVWYMADGDSPKELGKTRVSIHMPKWLSRITLNVTDVRVQRLRDICEMDVYTEGAMISPTGPRLGSEVSARDNARNQFRRLWNSINGPDAWDANPWVVAYSFDVVKQNIDLTP